MFKPETPFEGWIYSEIKHIKKTLGNHLKHHWFIEGGFVLALLIYFAKRLFP